jgi:hypothetical protein
MPQCISRTLTRQLTVYRQRVVTAPVLLECETLSRVNVAQVLQETKVKGRERLFPPYVTLWTFLLQVLSPDGSCWDAGKLGSDWNCASSSAHPGSGLSSTNASCPALCQAVVNVVLWDMCGAGPTRGSSISTVVLCTAVMTTAWVALG